MPTHRLSVLRRLWLLGAVSGVPSSHLLGQVLARSPAVTPPRPRRWPLEHLVRNHFQSLKAPGPGVIHEGVLEVLRVSGFSSL